MEIDSDSQKAEPASPEVVEEKDAPCTPDKMNQDLEMLMEYPQEPSIYSSPSVMIKREAYGTPRSMMSTSPEGVSHFDEFGRSQDVNYNALVVEIVASLE